jgi:hypothetical protein
MHCICHPSARVCNALTSCPAGCCSSHRLLVCCVSPASCSGTPNATQQSRRCVCFSALCVCFSALCVCFSALWSASACQPSAVPVPPQAAAQLSQACLPAPDVPTQERKLGYPVDPYLAENAYGWDYGNSIPEDLHPKSLHASFSFSTTVWAARNGSASERTLASHLGRRVRAPDLHLLPAVCTGRPCLCSKDGRCT